MADLLPVADVRDAVLTTCEPLAPRRAPLASASGLVLSEVVRAGCPLPPFANSSMDGYALRASDTLRPPARLRVVGTLHAGDQLHTVVSAGESVRIMTGAPLPPGADAVCMLERTRSEEGGSAVVIEDTVGPGTNVRAAGEDIAEGSEVFGPGTLLGPAHIGVLASLGVEAVLAHPRPLVGVISTGDELVAAGGPLAPGKIRDSNRPALLARLQADQFPAVDLGIAADDEAALAELLGNASSRCDVIVTTGGVSVGDRDLTKIVLEKLSSRTMFSVQVAVKPAKPFSFGVLDAGGARVFGLPGNPVSALVSYELFVRPALRSMAGHRVLDRPRVSGVAGEDLVRERDGKLHLLRVTVRTGADGVLRVAPSGGQGSHMLYAMAGSNGLALLPNGDGARAGTGVEVMLLDADQAGLTGAQAAW